MHTLIAICAGIALIAVVVWGMIPSKSTQPGSADGAQNPNDRVIDPNDSYQIGLLIGMMGGNVADAAIARYALQRFEETHGRKATVRDMGTVAGLMSSLR